MREIRIVITDTSVSFPDGQELGRVGEHNATQLIIELPDDMVAGVDYHVIKFSLLSGTITSDIITDDDSKIIYISDGKIYCTLWQQLTASRGLSFTVEAYKVVDGTPSRIAKSPLVSGLRFELSAGADVDEQGYSLAVHVNTLDGRVGAAEGDISDLQATEHTHANKALLDTYTQTDEDLVGAIDKAHEHDNMFVIDKFTEDDNGRPLYDGEPIGGGGTVDITGKADKVTGATNGNLAGLNSSGNLTDSGISADDVSGAVDDRHDHDNKAVLDIVVNNGVGNKFLADDGTYKEVSGGVSGDYIPIVTTLPDDAEDGEVVYLKESYDGTEVIPFAVAGGGGNIKYNFSLLNYSGDLPEITATVPISLSMYYNDELDNDDIADVDVLLQLSPVQTIEGCDLPAMVLLQIGDENAYVWVESASDYFTVQFAAGWNLVIGDLDVGVSAYPLGSVYFPTLEDTPLNGMLAMITDYDIPEDDYEYYNAIFDLFFSLSKDKRFVRGIYEKTTAWERQKEVENVVELVPYDSKGVDEMRLENDTVHRVTLSDDCWIILPDPDNITDGYDHTIVVKMTLTADVNLMFSGVVVDDSVVTTAGYLTLFCSLNTDGGVWEVFGGRIDG